MNGKGSSPRNNHSPQFRRNYEAIRWSSAPEQMRRVKAKGWWTRQWVQKDKEKQDEDHD